MSGERQNIEPRLGFSPSDPARLFRNIRLLIDDGKRGINDAGLGSANLVFLTLKTLEINRLIEENRRDQTLLAIEEPEAHLHPHLQRSVYRHLFESVKSDGGANQPLSVFLTTHSLHIASVAPLRSLLLLKETTDSGAVGYSTASIPLNDSEIDDLQRYLDVTRAEMLFARGVILVEVDAERFLLPAFAENLGKQLDHLGITVCSVAGTNFVPYAKILSGLGIPFSIVTDWDPRDGKKPLGYNRALKLVRTREHTRTGEDQTDLINELKTIKDYDEFGERCEEFGVFTNAHTLEVDLFQDGFAAPMAATLREHNFGTERKGWIDDWEEDPDALHVDKFLAMIGTIGKEGSHRG